VSLGSSNRRPYRHRELGFVVDLGGGQAVANPLHVPLSGVPAKILSRAYHLLARARQMSGSAMTPVVSNQRAYRLILEGPAMSALVITTVALVPASMLAILTLSSWLEDWLARHQ
jgi:hypothetical protein